MKKVKRQGLMERHRHAKVLARVDLKFIGYFDQTTHPQTDCAYDFRCDGTHLFLCLQCPMRQETLQDLRLKTATR